MEDADFTPTTGGAHSADYDLSMCTRDRETTEAVLEKVGYREALAEGQESQSDLQAGFDAGYSATVRLGYACGTLRGIVAALVAVLSQGLLREGGGGTNTNALMATRAEACDLKDSLSRILGGIAGVSVEGEEPGQGGGEKGGEMEWEHLRGRLTLALEAVNTLLLSPAVRDLRLVGDDGLPLGGSLPGEALTRKLLEVKGWLSAPIL
jgi:hypothetical protein